MLERYTESDEGLMGTPPEEVGEADYGAESAPTGDRRCLRGVARRGAEWSVTLPSFLWLVVLFVVPTVIVFAIAFKPATPTAGSAPAGRSTRSAASATRTTRRSSGARSGSASSRPPSACCSPCRWATTWPARPKRWQNTLLLLVIIPFWTSFLVRIFAWKVLLHPEGPLKQALVALGGRRARHASCSTTPGAVLLVLVYT